MKFIYIVIGLLIGWLTVGIVGATMYSQNKLYSREINAIYSLLKTIEVNTRHK